MCGVHEAKVFLSQGARFYVSLVDRILRLKHREQVMTSNSGDDNAAVATHVAVADVEKMEEDLQLVGEKRHEREEDVASLLPTVPDAEVDDGRRKQVARPDRDRWPLARRETTPTPPRPTRPTLCASTLATFRLVHL